MHSEEWKRNEGRLKHLSPEERKAFASSGGKASAHRRKERKKIKEIADAMLSCELSGDKRDKLAEMFPELDDDDMTYAAYAVLGQILAASGEGHASAKAFEQLVDLQEYREKRDEEKDALTKALEEVAKKL